jgi:hypothetical protein
MQLKQQKQKQKRDVMDSRTVRRKQSFGKSATVDPTNGVSNGGSIPIAGNREKIIVVCEHCGCILRWRCNENKHVLVDLCLDCLKREYSDGEQEGYDRGGDDANTGE